jgi:hypothetical protein
MPATDRRPRGFLFEPARFKNDPAVMRMSPAARGLYAMLFCEGWDMPEAGVFPADDQLLAAFARTELSTWLQLRNEVATAYDTASRPGFWVQKGTVETCEAQKLWIDSRIESGRLGGIASGKARRSTPSSRGSTTASSTPEAPLEAPLEAKRSGRVGVGGGGVGRVLTEKAKRKDSDSMPASTSGNGQVQTVRTRTGKTLTPEASAQIQAMRDAGLLPPTPLADETHFEAKP